MRVFTVLFDAPCRSDGITDLQRHFRREVDAQAFAALNKHYGEPSAVSSSEVPRRIADRWEIR